MRRSRIKAVANVPIRRKVETKPEEETPNDPIKEAPIENVPTPTEPLPETIPKPVENTFRRFKVQAKIPERKKPTEPLETPAEPPKVQIISVTNIPPLVSPIRPGNLALTSPISRIVPQSPTHYPELGVTYPRPPASPCKLLNRPRIRSTPRLGHRRNSTSASESEDDSRRTLISRIRNDSVSSVVGGAVVPEVENNVPAVVTNVNGPPPKKRVRRSDIARKMAEARCEFNFKFGTKKPDRQKLTMMDLIFYNPSSNPMPVRPKKEIEKPIETPEEAAIVEEEADEPEEEAMPVPQVKIGENGELILDEQSIVIETSDSRRSKELTSAAINYDDLDTGYGIYKRFKRTKDWSHAETKQFYRVLQMIGTDFSLMLGYFKGRTRRDLKLKFKKEEKTNRPLVDKILLNPKTFDLEELQKTLDKDQEIANKQEEERRKLEEEKKAKKMGTNGNKRQRKSSMFARQTTGAVAVMRETLTKPRVELEDPSSVYNNPKRKKKLQRSKSYDTDDELSDDQEDERINNMFSIPTRSGRIPKPRIGIEPDKPRPEENSLGWIKPTVVNPPTSIAQLEIELGLRVAPEPKTQPEEPPQKNSQLDWIEPTVIKLSNPGLRVEPETKTQPQQKNSQLDWIEPTVIKPSISQLETELGLGDKIEPPTSISQLEVQLGLRVGPEDKIEPPNSQLELELSRIEQESTVFEAPQEDSQFAMDLDMSDAEFATNLDGSKVDEVEQKLIELYSENLSENPEEELLMQEVENGFAALNDS